MSDQPHYFVTGRCWSCGTLTSFDPNRVPSMPLDTRGRPVESEAAIATREPLCRECVLAANVERRAAGKSAWSEDPTIWEPVAGLPE